MYVLNKCFVYKYKKQANKQTKTPYRLKFRGMYSHHLEVKKTFSGRLRCASLVWGKHKLMFKSSVSHRPLGFQKQTWNQEMKPRPMSYQWVQKPLSHHLKQGQAAGLQGLEPDFRVGFWLYQLVSWKWGNMVMFCLVQFLYLQMIIVPSAQYCWKY